MESEYREFWELGYPDELKFGLMRALIQARAVLGWIHGLQASGVDLDHIRIVPRVLSDAAAESIGGSRARDVVERARAVERALYEVSQALVPPSRESLPVEASSAYQPFDVIESIEFTRDDTVVSLKPIIVLDDAHTLHPEQFVMLRNWLARRELLVARWVLTRYDALSPHQVLSAPGPASDREITTIRMQPERRNGSGRKDFRSVAKDMSERYLRRWDTFSKRGYQNLAVLLDSEPATISASNLEKLRLRVDKAQESLGVPEPRRAELEARVRSHLGRRDSEDLRLAMVSIAMERYARRVRTQIRQLDLFTDDPDLEVLEPSKPIVIDGSMADGAAIHLLHLYDRPYYFGIDTVCDAASENAEQFLHFAASLLGRSEAKSIRGDRRIGLSAQEQNRALRAQAAALIEAWDFPHVRHVRTLIDGIAVQCRAKSLEPTAPLGGGAQGLGVPQEQFDALVRSGPDTPPAYQQLAEVLQFGVAYNAITVVQNHSVKHKKWCVIELGGAALVKNGLTLRRGGFIESRVEALASLVAGGPRA